MRILLQQRQIAICSASIAVYAVGDAFSTATDTASHPSGTRTKAKAKRCQWILAVSGQTQSMNSLVVVAGGLAIMVLLLLSAFFSSSETAIFSLSRDWIEQQATTPDRRAHVLKELHDDPHRLLVTLLVGNNIVNIAISSIMTVLVASYLAPGPAVIATTVVTSVLILILGEIVPKAFGLGNAKHWALTIAAPIGYVERGLAPLITLFDGITRRMSALITVETDIEQPYLD